MIIFINWLTFLGSCFKGVGKALKEVVPEWNDLVKANKDNKLTGGENV